MSKLNTTIKTFTPTEYKKLSVAQINEMIDKDIPFTVSKFFYFEEDLSFCLGNQTLYRNGRQVTLTPLERKFLAFLISRPGEIIDIETIRNKVWNKTNVTIFTIRNIINKIRSKTYYEIIKNVSNKGYLV